MDQMNPFYEPDLHRAIVQLTGKMVTVQTTNGSIRGHLHEAMPDYLLIHVENIPFHVRIAQMIWIFPGI